MARYVLKERTVVDVIDTEIVEQSNGELDGAITTFRGEEKAAAERYAYELEQKAQESV